MGRYKDTFKIKSAKQQPKAIGSIPIKDTDLYVTYNSSDRLDLISYRVYSDPKYWWVILSANGYKLEFDIEDGEILRIPYPLSDAINAIRKNTNG